MKKRHQQKMRYQVNYHWSRVTYPLEKLCMWGKHVLQSYATHVTSELLNLHQLLDSHWLRTTFKGKLLPQHFCYAILARNIFLWPEKAIREK